MKLLKKEDLEKTQYTMVKIISWYLKAEAEDSATGLRN